VSPLMWHIMLHLECSVIHRIYMLLVFPLFLDPSEAGSAHPTHFE
jgi:hypothetical protein